MELKYNNNDFKQVFDHQINNNAQPNMPVFLQCKKIETRVISEMNGRRRLSLCTLLTFY